MRQKVQGLFLAPVRPASGINHAIFLRYLTIKLFQSNICVKNILLLLVLALLFIINFNFYYDLLCIKPILTQYLFYTLRAAVGQYVEYFKQPFLDPPPLSDIIQSAEYLFHSTPSLSNIGWLSHRLILLFTSLILYILSTYFCEKKIWIMWVICFYAQRGASSTRISSWLMQPLVLCVFVMAVARGQVRYSIPEEMTKGSLVGNIVQDLGLDVKRLKSGRARIFTEDSREYIGLNVDKGTLVVKERIDREELCAQVSPCSLHFQIILENPMELHRIDVEILDINDHAPVLLEKRYTFR